MKRTSFTAKLVLGLIILGVFGSICSTIRNQSRQSAEAERRAALTPQQRDAEARAAAAQRKVEAERDAKFQRVLAVARAVKNNANDPKSIEFEEAMMTDTGAIAVSYRGRNAFGGVILNHTVVAPDGRSASGTKSDIAKLWNKHIANQHYDDFTSNVRGAQRIGAL